MKTVGFLIFILLFYLTDLNLKIDAHGDKDHHEDPSKFTNDLAQHCGDTGNCNRSLCEDKRHVPPPECIDHVDEMECFRVCKDPKILLDCLAEKNGTKGAAYCAILFRRKILSTGPVGTTSEHIALPCKIKCRTEPKLWSCIHKCDERGCFRAFKDCESKPRNGTVDPRPWCDAKGDPDYLTRMECRDCYVYNLTTELKDSKECSLRYSFSGGSQNEEDEDVVTSNVSSSSSSESPTSTIKSQPINITGTSGGPDIKKEIRFGDVQPRCIYHKDIEEGKKPGFNETLPFILITDCLMRKGIIFPDFQSNTTAPADNTTGSSVVTSPPTTLASETSTQNSTEEPLVQIDPSKLASSDYLEKCVKVELAARQLHWCAMLSFYKECLTTTGTSRACQQHCLTHLTKPYCYIPCPRNPAIEICEEDCARNFPLIDCDCVSDSNLNKQGLKKKQRTDFFLNPLKRLQNFKDQTKDCKNQSCYYFKLHDEKPTPKEDDDPNLPDPNLTDPNKETWKNNVTMLRNCKSFRHVKFFSQKLASALNRPGVFSDDLQKLASYFTLYECKVLDCKKTYENDAAHCAKRCVTKERKDMKEGKFYGMSDVCDNRTSVEDKGFPARNFLRAEITLWCMLTTFKEKTSWSLQDYFNLANNLQDYKKMVQCEEDARNLSKSFMSASIYETFAQITYELEAEWCKQCTVTDEDHPHEYEVDHVECEIDRCYNSRVKDTCVPLKSTAFHVKLDESTECSWQVDFSLSREPTRLWSTYFDEISPHDETNTLQKPYTLDYLMKSVVTFGKGHYVFPYFVVIRPFCDNGFYDEKVYKADFYLQTLWCKGSIPLVHAGSFIASGASPIVKITIFPYSSRAKYVDLMVSEFQGALINLERITDVEKRYIPRNPLNRKLENDTEYDGKSGCHLEVCYPAFAVPQVLINIPFIETKVFNQQIFNKINHLSFVNTMHVRDIPGVGMLKVANKTDPPTADLFFPKEKSQVYEDVQIVDLWSRLPDSGYKGEDDNLPGPEIEYETDHNCIPIKKPDLMEVGGNPFAPLDTEDFLRVQYTHGNAPQIVIAGFYDPNLVIIGDPDMKKFELARWGFEATGGRPAEPTPRLFTGYYKCFSHHYPLGGYIKPMYSVYDRLDPFYWLQFYRMRYQPKNYTDTVDIKAVFEAFALEDRILLLTSSGLVSLYHNYNMTALLGKQWEVEGYDRLEKCFKIVRIARKSHPVTDTIVGITYDYQVNDAKRNETKEVSQEVYIGRYVGAGKPIEWEQIVGGVSTHNLKEERVYNTDGDKLGEPAPLPMKKLIDIPVERRETTPRSQIEAICYIVYRNKMGKAEYIELIEDQGWCEAIDATPVVAVESKIQVLVRMKAYYSGGTGGGGLQIKRVVFFYVVASINTDKAASLYSIWQIDSIIPRIPCLDEHTQSIPNVVQFNMEYFRKGDPSTVGTKYGCHEMIENKRPINHIFLHGMTYTRSFHSHMFLYGNKLLQSTDGGQTFVHLKSFPARDDPVYFKACMNEGGKPDRKQESQLAYHRIKLMAFDDTGHYAFLTSKRELWYGNLGTLQQIRLRPSPAHSMILTTLYEVREISEAVPFALFFDTNNELVEMVAVVDANETVTRIARRVMDYRVILRAMQFVERFDKEGDIRFDKFYDKVKLLKEGNTKEPPQVDPEVLSEIRYDPVTWSVFCPFASPVFHHNFSEKHARTLNFFFPPPRQHPHLGIVNVKSTLMTYQAVTFSLAWNGFFSETFRQYSFLHEDPFLTWKRNKVDAAVIGRLKYLNLKPEEHGVLVLPDKYRRKFNKKSDSERLFKLYYLDYNMIVRITIEYSISNDFSINIIDYVHHHLSAIQLNVDNSNGSLIQINTEKEVIASKAAVSYVIHMSVKKNTGLPQSYSGRNILSVPVYFHLIGGFGKCVTSESSGIIGDSHATGIVVGCPPSTDLVFDWNSTVHSIKFRNHSAHFGGEMKHCYENEYFCFFQRYPLILHFHKFDASKQAHANFSGKFIMRIVGGGYTRDQMKDYTVEEQQAFNVPGVSDVSLIWNEWDSVGHQKKEHKGDIFKSGRNDSREIVLQAGVSAIKWACHTLSPCARISPRANFESIFYFKIFITNRGVDNDTLCLFEKEFIILLYGFPPSPEIQLITTVIFYIFVLALLYVVYLFFRNKKKLWKSSILKLQGWLQIVKDTFPKTWGRDSSDDIETEEERQKRHDDIIMSLQGHLNVPYLVPKHTGGPTVTKTSQVSLKKTESETSHEHSLSGSLSSVKSGTSSTGSRNPMLNPVAGRAGAATWTDMIYEQIISKRLAAIVEKNRQQEEELKKKAMRGDPAKK